MVRQICGVCFEEMQVRDQIGEHWKVIPCDTSVAQWMTADLD
jgi:hypothetical protein